MKRWLPPTRPLILITLLVLAGAVVNVAVAWVLVGAPGNSGRVGAMGSVASYEPPRYDKPPPPDARPRFDRLRSRIGSPDEWEWETSGGFGWDVASLGSWAPQPFREQYGWAVRQFRAGWPLRSLTLFVTGRHDKWHFSPSLEPPRPLLKSDWFRRSARVPVQPLLPGFVLNTILYAAILALPLSFFPIRRRRRARCDRCPKCGYDLAALAGADPAAPCPECGATR